MDTTNHEYRDWFFVSCGSLYVVAEHIHKKVDLSTKAAWWQAHEAHVSYVKVSY